MLKEYVLIVIIGIGVNEGYQDRDVRVLVNYQEFTSLENCETAKNEIEKTIDSMELSDKSTTVELKSTCFPK